MADEVTPDRVEKLALDLLGPAVQAARALAAVRQRLAPLLQEDAEAYQEAARFYTPAQLKQLGFAPPLRRVRGRPAAGGRKPRGKPREEPAASPASAPDGAPDGGAGGFGLSAVG